MADYNKGFVQDAKQKVTRTISQTVTGLAETALDDINKWRTVLAANPGMLPFNLPPTLQRDIDNLNSTIAFTGLKIPPLDSLETDLKKALGNLANPVLLDANKSIDGFLGANGGKDKLKTLISQIDWLG